MVRNERNVSHTGQRNKDCATTASAHKHEVRAREKKLQHQTSSGTKLACTGKNLQHQTSSGTKLVCTVGTPNFPRILREHRWSVLDVPLMWDAPGQGGSTLVLDWLCVVSAEFPALLFNGGSVFVSEAAWIGWLSLRTAMRAWGIARQEDLSMWLRRGSRAHRLAITFQ